MFTNDDIETAWRKIRRCLGMPERQRVAWLPDISTYETRPNEGDFYCGEGCCDGTEPEERET